jgi:hypothetical protein
VDSVLALLEHFEEVIVDLACLEIQQAGDNLQVVLHAVMNFLQQRLLLLDCREEAELSGFERRDITDDCVSLSPGELAHAGLHGDDTAVFSAELLFAVCCGAFRRVIVCGTVHMPPAKRLMAADRPIPAA